MNNNMICDLETGVCGVAEGDEIEVIDFNQPKKTVNLYYVTDPICSHCWALEPVLRRFVEEYGHYFNFHTVMGGLLEKWGDGPVDPANGIFGPSDVTKHWREVGKHFRMPIDGSLMIDHPVQSSYPPSRVFKIIQKEHGDTYATEFLRRAREALFVFNQNIGERDTLIDLVNKTGLDGQAIVTEAEGSIGQDLLNEDFAFMRSLGVRGFPTIVMVNEENKGVKIVGGRPLEYYVQGLKQILNDQELEAKQAPALSSLLEKEKLLFSKEIEELYGINQEEVHDFIRQELPQDSYQLYEFQEETYVTIKNNE